MKYNGNKKFLIEDFMEDVAVSFLFSEIHLCL